MWSVKGSIRMILSKLIKDINGCFVYGHSNLKISSVVYDSRKITSGSLFVCIRGYNFDGHDYIKKAIEDGAVAIVVEELPYHYEQDDVTYIRVNDTREALAQVSAAWFDYPAKKLTVIGLTGTKGKTTTAHMIKSILEEAGHMVGMIGTIGAYIGNEKIPTKNTTPESYELHFLFHQMVEQGCSYVVMEVSSQALKMKRTFGIQFNYSAFLNISPDHISPNEHKDFNEYMQCKKKLFSQCDYAIINIDADYWDAVTKDCKEVYTVSCEEQADFMAREIENIWKPGFLGVSYKVSGSLGGEFALNMPGAYNVQNALIASAVCNFVGVGVDQMGKALKTVSVVGRTQVIQEVAHFTTFLIDYAHNAISMESLLSTLKDYNPDRLVCIFGGGGNKPAQRRFDMGKMAGKYADLSIITMDNPRYESMESINQEIVRGINSENGIYKIIDDRKEAIEYMIDNSGRRDIVALIGKGHEEYQEVYGKKYFFSELQIIQNYLETK